MYIYTLYMYIQSRVAAGFSRFSKNIPKPFLMYIEKCACCSKYMYMYMYTRALILYMYMYMYIHVYMYLHEA